MPEMRLGLSPVTPFCCDGGWNQVLLEMLKAAARVTVAATYRRLYGKKLHCEGVTTVYTFEELDQVHEAFRNALGATRKGFI